MEDEAPEKVHEVPPQLGSFLPVPSVHGMGSDPQLPGRRMFFKLLDVK